MNQPITDEINKILAIQQSAYKDATTLLFNSLNQRIDDQNKLIYEQRHSLEFSQNDLRDMKNKYDQVYTEVSKYCKCIDLQQETIDALQQQLAKQEDYSRRKNIKLEGVAEVNNENWEQTQNKVQKILQEKMKLENVSVEFAHRIRKPENHQGPRTVIAQLNRAIDRDIIMRNSSKLKGTNISLTRI